MDLEIYFLRHGAAVPAEEWNGPDRARPLTARGVAETRRIGAAIRALGVAFDAVLASPYSRARETARLITSSTDPVPPLRDSDGLVVYGDGEVLVADLRRVATEAAASRVLLVGHEPSLREIVSMLVAGSLDCAFRIEPGALGKLRAEGLEWGRCAILDWILQPDHLFEIAAQCE